MLREHRTARALLLPTLLLGCLVVEARLLRPALLDEGVPTAAASTLALAILAVALVAMWSAARWASSNDFAVSAPPDSVGVALGVGATVGLCAALLLRSWAQLGPVATPATALLAATATYGVVLAKGYAHRASRAQRLIGLGSATAAEAFVERCRAELRDPALRNRERDVVELSLAAALADLSTYDDRFDSLPEALRIAARLHDRVHPAWTVAALLLLAPAVSNRARTTGDVAGLEQVLDLTADVLDRGPRLLAIVEGMVLSERVDALLLLSDWAEAIGDAERVDELYAEAIGALERGRPLTHRWSINRANVELRIAGITAMRSPSTDLGDEVDRCRVAVRRLRWRRLRRREEALLGLADLLVEQAGREDAPVPSDSAEAIALLELVATKGRAAHRAWQRLAILHAVLCDEVPVSAHAFRMAFATLAANSFSDAAELAERWSQWAMEGGHADEAAEAHWCLLRALANESRRRLLHAEPHLERSELQLLAAQSAARLVTSGRTREAALALDLGRTVQLAEAMHGQRAGIEERLETANRWDLLDRWRTLSGSAPRAIEVDQGETIVSGQRFRSAERARDYPALVEQERLVREIGRLPRFDDVPVAATYSELREAAHDGPLVYLAATEDGGFAIIVAEQAAAPAVVALPEATASHVRGLAGHLVDGPCGPHASSAALEPVLGWLGHSIIRPLMRAVPAGALVTLIPVGAIGLLPIHCAGLTRRPDNRWQDGTGGLVFRYAPGCRALLRAGEAARTAGGPDLALLTIVAPNGPTSDASTQAQTATAPFSERIGTACAPAPAELPAALAAAPIWHVACRCEHDPRDPLTSRLHLPSGVVSLRDVLAADAGRQRLAVLSNCRTSPSSRVPLDETVSAASAWLDGAIAGVVSSHFVIDERAATLLVARFFQRFLDGDEPARALAEAQRWLASATNHQVHEALGELHRPPADLSLEQLRRWAGERPFTDPRCWALFSYAGA